MDFTTYGVCQKEVNPKVRQKLFGFTLDVEPFRLPTVWKEYDKLSPLIVMYGTSSLYLWNLFLFIYPFT